MYESENDEHKKDEDLKIGSVSGLHFPLESDRSTRISLDNIRKGDAGLNKHREALLNRVPNQNEWAKFEKNEIEIKDLAYLSAWTGDEFALMRGKNSDILFHGDPLSCHLENDDMLMSLFYSHKIALEAHSHPDFERIVPSTEDRNFLKAIGQKESKIISSYTGKIVTFTQDRFDFS